MIVLRGILGDLSQIRCSEASVTNNDAEVKAIAFYLPQYHPNPENDEWWGKGFTEWRNVAKARPNFEAHYQPHAPGDLGFYDLRIAEVMEAQAALAKEYGLYGFCFYHYWFNGRQVLDLPLKKFLANPKADIPFCLCWANENWTRRWDGADHEILLGQNHNIDDDEAFIRHLLPIFEDPRYIKVAGKPMLLVYRVDLFPDSKATAALWRRIAKEAGYPDLHLCAVQFYGVTDPAPWGFDAAVEFPPHTFLTKDNLPIETPQKINPNWNGGIFDYLRVAADAITRKTADYLWYRGVMPSWDNTARRQDTSHIFWNSSPAHYNFWLRKIVDQTARRLEPNQRFVFINAWNEWGEGCHLEPDLKYGHAYLEATRNALHGITTIDAALTALQAEGSLIDNKIAAEISDRVTGMERSLLAFHNELRRKSDELHFAWKMHEEARNQIMLQAHGSRRLVRSILNRFPRFKRLLKKLLGRP